MYKVIDQSGPHYQKIGAHSVQPGKGFWRSFCILPCLQVELTLHLLPEWPSRDIENRIPLCPRIIHGTENSYSFIQSQTQEIHSGLQKYSPLDLCPGFLAPEGSWLQCGSLLPRTGSTNQYNRAEQLTLIAHRCLSHCVQDSVELSRFSRKKHHD